MKRLRFDMPSHANKDLFLLGEACRKAGFEVAREDLAMAWLAYCNESDWDWWAEVDEKSLDVGDILHWLGQG